MRVLDTTTLKFKEFPDLPDEPYAILSHRWGSEEVNYKEYRKSRETVQHRAGYKKITEFCHVAQQRGFRYAWIDTCCIDKRSSAELSEAINSMFRWYKKSEECYVYLEDYRQEDPSSLRACEWFRRGWTLQELIAPTYCIFFTAVWTVIGHKHSWARSRCKCETTEGAVQANKAWGPDLLEILSDITKVEENLLNCSRGIWGASIAQRMSWASQRTTTRVEDRAYSLLGIFGVNMPLLYGEGPRAFRRLQEEIIRTTHETSIFCFDQAKSHSLIIAQYSYYHDSSALPLAVSPDQFSQCEDIWKSQIESDEPYSITQRGLRVVAPAYTRLWKGRTPDKQPLHAIPLVNCNKSDETMYLIVQQPFSKKPDDVDVLRVGVQSSKEIPPQFEKNLYSYYTWEPTPSRLFFIKHGQ